MKIGFKKYWLIAGIVVVFLGLRLWNLQNRINFSMDQGMASLRSYDIWKHKELALLGPEASPIINGRHFFFGSIIYYFTIIIMLPVNWNPVGTSVILVGLSGLSVFIFYKVVAELNSKNTGLIAVMIWTCVPMLIDFAHLIWNPNFLLLLTPLIMWVALKAFKTNKIIYFGLTGLLLGMGLQFHFQTGLLILMMAGLMGWKKVGFDKWIAVLLGGVMGYAPLIIFDMRNNFYNLKTMSEWLMSGGGAKQSWPVYYFVVIFPFLIAGVARFLTNKRGLTYVGIAMLFIYAVGDFVTTKQAKGMPDNWNLSDLLRTTDIVEKNVDNNFNVVNLLSGDTKFYPLRFMLAKDGYKVGTVDNYKDNDELIVVAKDLKNEVWEIQQLGKYKTKDVFKINSQVNLYLLQRI